MRRRSEITVKICKGKIGCGESKNVEEFALNQNTCRECKRFYSKQRRKDPIVKQQEKDYRDKWNQANPNYYSNYNNERKDDLEYRKRVNKTTAEWKKRNPEKANEQWHTRRASKYATEYEKIDNEIVFKRDNYICQICIVKVDLALQWPDPMSKSLDHVIPLSKGGTHLYSNVRLAHLICNLKKHNKIMEEV